MPSTLILVPVLAFWLAFMPAVVVAQGCSEPVALSAGGAQTLLRYGDGTLRTSG